MAHRGRLTVLANVIGKGIAQVWFPGAHADVGGGYPKAESGLSDIALTWMTEQLAAIGMAFATPLTYDPQSEQFDQDMHEPWKNPPFSFLDTSPREVRADDAVHESVLQRWRKVDTYRPAALKAWAEQRDLEDVEPIEAAPAALLDAAPSELHLVH